MISKLPKMISTDETITKINNQSSTISNYKSAKKFNTTLTILNTNDAVENKLKRICDYDQSYKYQSIKRIKIL